MLLRRKYSLKLIIFKILKHSECISQEDQSHISNRTFSWPVFLAFLGVMGKGGHSLQDLDSLQDLAKRQICKFNY